MPQLFLKTILLGLYRVGLADGQSHENGGYLFRAFRTGTKSKILTFVIFFCVFQQVLYQGTKSEKA
jgi:hypothetical protein